MNTYANDGEGKMVKLNVTVPRRLPDEIDELVEELAYPNSTAFTRVVQHGTMNRF